MSSLRDEIARVCYETEIEQSPFDSADAIIALFRERLLSDEAVRALTRTLVELGNGRAAITDDTWPDDYNDMHVVVMMDESLAAITAALDAVTTGGGDQ